MVTRNVPDGDSVELYFTLPSLQIPVATTFVIEAKLLGTSVVVPTNYLYFAVNENAFVPIVKFGCQDNRLDVCQPSATTYAMLDLNGPIR
jgi:hypothetical protein